VIPYSPIRLSHLVRHAAPGSIIRASNELLMVLMDTRYWTKHDGSPIGKPLKRVKMVSQQIADGKKLFFPPKSKLNSKQLPTPKENTLPAVIFPQWSYCPTCYKMYKNPWYDKENNQQIENPKCVDKKCKNNLLQQLPWILVHKDGYMDEIPWHFLAHNKESKDCRDRESLTYKEHDKNITIKCTACQSTSVGLSKDSLKAESRFNGLISMRKQPWVNESAPEKSMETAPIAFEAGDASVFMPESKDALVIPPESRRIKENITGKLQNNQQLMSEIDRSNALGVPPSEKRSRLNRIARGLKCSREELESAIEELNEVDTVESQIFESLTDGQLLELEYQALLKEINDFTENEDFITQHYTKIWKELNNNKRTSSELNIISLISEVVLVQRLRKIEVYKGFHRPISKENIASSSHHNAEDNKQDDITPPDLEGLQNWLPAIELFGEGIFIAFNEEIISKWEKIDAVRARASILKKRWDSYIQTNHVFNEVIVTPRFILLHTIAHLMIRQLESDVGYPAASLSERLYVQKGGSQSEPMLGILIYVVVADKAGSLGGLAEMAKPDKLLSLLTNIFERAQWCALDPVCSEHQGNGPGLLNMSACHGCALVPDTSCDFGNTLLDRTLVKGSDDIPSILSMLDKEVK